MFNRLAFAILLCCVSACAEDIYVSQSGAGTGVSCADSRSAAWFNTADNWGGGAGEIDPGDTVHLCGTFTGTASANMLTIQASGTAGNVITLLFEAGAYMTAPYWNATQGAIYCSSKDYITVDGGTDGYIENTDNGTALTYQQTSRGVAGDTCNNFTVQDLAVRNFYIRTENSSDETDVICISTSNSDNVLFTRNTIDHCRIGFAFSGSGTFGPVEISHNNITFGQHQITVGVSGQNGVISGINIHDNDFGGGAYLWDHPTNYCHHNAVHIFWEFNTSRANNIVIYNNRTHGLWSRDTVYNGSHITAMIYIEITSDTPTYIFNNVFDLSTGGVLNKASNGFVNCQLNCKVYNNTFMSESGYGTGLNLKGQPDDDIRNNLFVSMQGFYCPLFTHYTSNYNVYYQTQYWGNFYNFAGWKALDFTPDPSPDANSITTNPLVDATTYRLGAGSPAISLGANLTALGLTALNVDKSGVARPATGAWDAGAYQYAAPPPAHRLGNGKLRGGKIR